MKLRLLEDIDELVSSDVSLTLRGAMSVIDRGGQQIAIFLDSRGNLKGVLTDGDVRRALLGGLSLESLAWPVVNQNPICIASKSPSDAKLLTRKTGVSRIILGEIGSPPKGVFISDDNLMHSGAPPVLIMAGGRGSRLGLLTQKTPKPLINVAGEPILHRILKSLSSFGFQDIYISVNYLADQIIDSVADGKVFGLNVAYVFEDSPMGTAGAIGKIKGIEDFENLLVMNADLVADIDFSKLLDYHGQNHLDLTVVARENVTQVPYGVLKILNGFVQGVEEKPTYTDLISAGVYVLSKKIFGLIPNQAIDMPDLINMAAALGSRVGAFPIHLQWIDIGNPEDLDRAQQYLGDVS